MPIIDIRSLESVRDNSEGSWSVASNTLENSSKLYAYRVDFMGENVSRISNIITRNMMIQKSDAHTEESHQI